MILNGIGAAGASIEMLAESTGSTTGSSDPGVAAQGSECSTHHAVPAESGKGSGSKADGGHNHSSSDCCKSTTCRCMCMHACASMMLTAMQQPTLLIPHDLRVSPLAVGHQTPVLPHLIRPPIG
ncbi:CopL family metal-binding regulatory protein [Xanthomonas arboricola]|uniref:CopL family metal-binding regulatory protein n=1 Tax=Xanthomonas arboricola TaxID=56448 RepID=UPI003CCE9445